MAHTDVFDKIWCCRMLKFWRLKMLGFCVWCAHPCRDGFVDMYAQLLGDAAAPKLHNDNVCICQNFSLHVDTKTSKNAKHSAMSRGRKRTKRQQPHIENLRVEVNIAHTAGVASATATKLFAFISRRNAPIFRPCVLHTLRDCFAITIAHTA